MKQYLLAFLTLVCVTPLFAQNSLRQLISGDRGVSKQLTLLPQSLQLAFRPTNARSIFGLDANSDLVIINSETDNLGFTHYRYAQTFKSIPVENAMYIAHTRGGALRSAGGGIITDFAAGQAQTATDARLSPQQAIDAALQSVNAEKWAWQDAAFEQDLKESKGRSATYYPAASKVWYGGEEIDPARLQLAYKVDVYSLKPFDRKYIFIDAQTGKVIGQKAIMLPVDEVNSVSTIYSGPQAIHSDNVSGTYRLRDYSKGNGIVTLNGAGNYVDYTSSSSTWSLLQGKDRYALDAHYGVGATWTFYFTNFNRNSVDNNGFMLRSYVNDASIAGGNGGNSANAYWDGTNMRYGYLSNGVGLTSLDITGHELTHGVTQYTSQLAYNKEPGAINESMSDIMGKSVQFYTKPNDINWQLSNDIPWIIRDMANPNAKSQPDTYGGAYWINTVNCNATSSNDYCGVHTNSGVGNFMFYLLVTGGSGQNDLGNTYTVSGIGLAKADQIIYRTNTTYLTPASKYTDWRTACIQAATDLYGGASNEVMQVTNAWYAVGVGSAAAACNPPSGLTTTGITSTSASLAWTAAGGAQSYTLQWKVATATTWTTVTGITTNAYNLTGLTAGITYSFQVATVCSGGTSAYSSAANFSTTAASPLGGLTYKYYEGNWNSLPDFNTLTPVKTGTSANVDISVRTAGRDDNFAFVWQGYITIPTAGTYTFETISDDGSKLYFNSLYIPTGNATVNNDGLHAPVSATGTVSVQAAGTYPIAITFFEKDGGEQMQVYWAGPNFARQPIPNSAFITSAPSATTGLTYKYYEGDWNSLPDFNALTPVKTGIGENIDLSVRPPGVNDYFGFVWEGYINIPVPGMYTFETISDDGSKVYFNTLYDPAATPVVNNDGLHAPVSASGIVNVAVAGVYPISITFFEKNGGEQMQVYWTGPNFARQPIPNSAFTTTPPPLASGLSYKYYEGNWNSLPDFNALAPVKTGNSPNVDLAERRAGINDNFGFVWQGYINIPAPGIYTFETVSDDGSKVYFNSLYDPAATATVNNDGLHAPLPASGTVNITAAGVYPIAITFFEKDGGEQMQVYWAGPNIPRQLIPNTAFSMYTPLAAEQQVWQSIGNSNNNTFAGKLHIGRIYPNPFSESISIDVYNNSAANDISAGIYDINGRLLYLYRPGKFAAGNNRLQLDLGGKGLADGYYIVKININGTTVKTVKMVKAKR